MMSTDAAAAAETRAPLSRQRVLHAAVELADREGLEALTMRRLAQDLGVEAMSLYHHVANKDAILDGVVEVVMAEVLEAVEAVDAPAPEDDWRAAMRGRILTAREVMLRHKWAPRVLETRTTLRPSVVLYYDGVLGTFRRGGFSYDLAHHALHALGSRVLGFHQELFEPDDAAEGEDEATAMLEQMADQFPYIVGMMQEISHGDDESTLGWCDDQFEFEFGLDLILDGLDRVRATA